MYIALHLRMLLEDKDMDRSYSEQYFPHQLHV